MSIGNFDMTGYESIMNSMFHKNQDLIHDAKSYRSIYDTIQRFRKPDWREIGDCLDMPTVKYFKIFFHFGNVSAYDMGYQDISSTVFTDAGLLIPTFMLKKTDEEGRYSGFEFEPEVEGITDYQYYRFNSAWAYLKNNGEDERAAMLQYFIQLLSDISSNYPWYFQSVEGLENAIDRGGFIGKEFKFEEERKKISIKCLPDALDDRIGTLLDLYRAIVGSWTTKRQILPPNLCKFNMSIFVVESPLNGITKKISKLAEWIPAYADVSNSGYSYGMFDKSPWDPSMNNGKVSEEISLNSSADQCCSYKLFEFHNCEFDYNSSKSGLGSLNNAEGVMPSYTIDISFDDCFEHRFNNVHGAELGDMLLLDSAKLFLSSEMEYLAEETKDTSEINKVQQSFKNISNAVVQKINTLNTWTKSFKQKWLQEMTEGAAKNLIQYGLPDGLLPADWDVNGKGLNWIENLAKSAFLGNLYGINVSKSLSNVDKLLSGDLQAGVNVLKDLHSAISDWVDDGKGDAPSGNITSNGSNYRKDTSVAKKMQAASEDQLRDGRTLKDDTDYGVGEHSFSTNMYSHNDTTPDLRESLRDVTDHGVGKERRTDNLYDHNDDTPDLRESLRDETDYSYNNVYNEGNLTGDNNYVPKRGEINTTSKKFDVLLNWKPNDELSKEDIVGHSKNDNFGSRVGAHQNDMKDSIQNETDYNVHGYNSMKNRLPESDADFSSRKTVKDMQKTLKGKNDFDAQLKQKQKDLMAKSLINNI